MEFKIFIYQRYDGYGYSYYEISDWLETCRGHFFETIKMPFIPGDINCEEYKSKSEECIIRSDCVIMPVSNLSDIDEYFLFDISTARQYEKPIVIVSDYDISEELKTKVNAVVKMSKESVTQSLIKLLGSKVI